MSGKLLFVLCRKCGENLCTSNYGYSSEEWALIGTWTMNELRKAVEKFGRVRTLEARDGYL